MTDAAFHAALGVRYDGPRPPLTALPPDWSEPWPTQIANRKRWAWREVRRLGHQMVSARRAFRATGALTDHRSWVRARGSLSHALATWAQFSDWLKRLEADNAAAQSLTQR